jgi:pimeloyl-ACP methyl ester carboxylesterase
MIYQLIFFLLVSGAFAGIQEINPGVTGAGIRKMKSNHLAIEPENSNQKLLISIGGTESWTSESLNPLRWAAEEGFFGIAVDYPNQVISTICQKSTDPTCFDRYRREIVYGQDVSPLISVDQANSIISRTQALVQWLAKKNTKWNVFLDGTTLRWERVTLIGHSQGAGHIAFISKFHQVEKVIMTGGPHDYFPGIGPAPWLTISSRTSSKNLYAFLHWQDFFGTETPIGSARALMHGQSTVLEDIDTHIPESSRAQIFITSHPESDPHNSLMNVEFRDVWKTILAF